MIKLVSLNVERSKHLDRIVPFLKRVKPDVVCLQELMESDVETISALVGGDYTYAPMARYDIDGRSGVMGVGFFRDSR